MLTLLLSSLAAAWNVGDKCSVWSKRGKKWHNDGNVLAFDSIKNAVKVVYNKNTIKTWKPNTSKDIRPEIRRFDLLSYTERGFFPPLTIEQKHKGTSRVTFNTRREIVDDIRQISISYKKVNAKHTIRKSVLVVTLVGKKHTQYITTGLSDEKYHETMRFLTLPGIWELCDKVTKIYTFMVRGKELIVKIRKDSESDYSEYNWKNDNAIFKGVTCVFIRSTIGIGGGRDLDPWTIGEEGLLNNGRDRVVMLTGKTGRGVLVFNSSEYSCHESDCGNIRRYGEIVVAVPGRYSNDGKRFYMTVDIHDVSIPKPTELYGLFLEI